jgi:hypothetical protein
MTLLLTGACSGSAGTSAQPPAQAAPPSPFILQFTGTYEDPQAPAGSIRWLRIDRDGTFEMMIQGAPAPESGTMATSSLRQLPVTLELDAGALGTVTVTITDYDGVLHVTLNGQTSTLRATGAVGPSESLCDDTDGVWRDSDPDPATGLYCTCSAGNEYIPDQGGCVP